MTIYAIDFDGTIVENRFSDIGPAIKETVDFIKAIQERGDKWILYTMREGEYLMQAMDQTRHCALKVPPHRKVC